MGFLDSILGRSTPPAADLDVRELVHRDHDPPALRVGEGQQSLFLRGRDRLVHAAERLGDVHLRAVEAQQRVQLTGGEEVVEEDVAARERGAEPVDAPVALDEAHRVPRHVEVDDHVAELQVQTFAARIGGD